MFESRQLALFQFELARWQHNECIYSERCDKKTCKQMHHKTKGTLQARQWHAAMQGHRNCMFGPILDRSCVTHLSIAFVEEQP